MNLLEGEIAGPYDHRYIATTHGRIYDTRREKWSSLSTNHRGYLVVTIWRVQKMVHRVVGTAFIPNPENKRTINHKNGIKKDNRIENLEWATHQENSIHSFRVLGRAGRNMSHKRGEKGIVAVNIETGKETKYQNRKYAALALGVGKSMITMAANGTKPTCRGYIIRHEKSLPP